MLIALGVSGIASIGNLFAQNSVTTMEYEEIIERGELPIKKGLNVDDDDLAARYERIVAEVRSR